MICAADPSLRMHTVKTVWFWLFIVAILLLIAYAVAYETTGTLNAQGVKVYPWWVWGLLGVAIFFLAIAFIFMIVGLVRENRRLKAACALAESQQFRDAAPQPGCHTLAGHPAAAHSATGYPAAGHSTNGLPAACQKETLLISTEILSPASPGVAVRPPQNAPQSNIASLRFE